MKLYRACWEKMRRPLAAIAVGGVMATTLQGCFVVAGTALFGGTMAAIDRRTLGAQTEDKVISVKGESQIASALPKEAHINVTSYNRKVLITGEVPTAAAKAAAEREARAVDGVVGVFNELSVAGASSYSSRSSDALITSKVVTAMMNQKFSANIIKVVTERGVVYLMGRVSHAEGKAAADVASKVGGVHKVVTLYEYLSDSEIREIEREAAARKPVHDTSVKN